MVARHSAARSGVTRRRWAGSTRSHSGAGIASASGPRATARSPVAARREQGVAQAVAHRALHAAEVRALGGEHVIEPQLVQTA